MHLTKTRLKSLYVLKTAPKVDERGYFVRTIDKDVIKIIDKSFKITQVSQSYTKKLGTIRGMHFQTAPMMETKIVQCIKGNIYDVAIDWREKSATFGKWFAIDLDDMNGKLLYIPKGFAHGFQTLTDNCIVQYFISTPYSPMHSCGLRWNDPFLNIKWPMAPTILFKKDSIWPFFTKEDNNKSNGHT